VCESFEKNLEWRLAKLVSNGVTIHDPRQVFVASDVNLDNIQQGVQLFPGVRIAGSHSILGKNALIGSEGPATLDNVAVDDNAEIASGFITHSVLLRGSKMGSSGHVRACTIFEEGASTAHAVGLKQTILMSFSTLGSLINFCDAIVAGGRSRSDHTEIGSGFINFNFTPWGSTGDKATPTLIGDVYEGALVNSNRVFLGGLSGIVGPAKVSFGAVTVAGQIIRQDVKENTILSTVPRRVEGPANLHSRLFSERKYKLNLEFISNLFALRTWYQEVRLARLPDVPDLLYKREVIGFAIALIDRMISERLERLANYLNNFHLTLPTPKFISHRCPVAYSASRLEHIDWLRSLDDEKVDQLKTWMKKVGESVWQP